MNSGLRAGGRSGMGGLPGGDAMSRTLVWAFAGQGIGAANVETPGGLTGTAARTPKTTKAAKTEQSAAIRFTFVLDVNPCPMLLEYHKAKAEGRMKNAERPSKATSSHPHATGYDEVTK